MYPDRTQRRWHAVKIYLDSYIATSFWMHFLCLRLVAEIGYRYNKKAIQKRMILGALLAVMSDVAVMLGLFRSVTESEVLAVLIALAELVPVTWITFGKRKVMLNSLLLLGITMFLSGLFSLLPVKNVGLYCMIGSLLLPIFSSGITAIFHGNQTEACLYQSEISNEQEKKQLTAFMDTGNRLRLYNTGIPVVLVDEKYLREWVDTAKMVMPHKFVVLPYKGVGGHGLLQGVRVRCKIYEDKNSVLEGEVAAVAAEHRLFSGCAYQMVLQPEVLQLPRCVEKV